MRRSLDAPPYPATPHSAPYLPSLHLCEQGLDPASRRALWEVVKQRKPGRGLILTTHSMEEAEVLCDRLGIYVDGRLVCIGNPKEITSRFAGYLVFTITVPQVCCVWGKCERFLTRRCVCFGNPKEITSRFAGYLVFTITVPQVRCVWGSVNAF